MKYLKVWTDFEDVLQTLEYDEIGRLFLAMLHYAGTGEEPPDFDGNERFLWPVARRSIDMMEEKSETLRQNGSKGGYAKSKNRQNVANDSKAWQNVANDSLKEKKRNEKKGNEKTSLLDDDDAHEIQIEHDRVLNAAEDAGFKMSNDVIASLIELYAINGLGKMLEAFRSCVDHGAPNLAYLKAVLNGEPRKEKPKVTAQAYGQRDYSGEQDDAMRRMLEMGVG